LFFLGGWASPFEGWTFLRGTALAFVRTSFIWLFAKIASLCERR
jgi:NADH:ubiquinone oxidoreductase subunit H